MEVFRFARENDGQAAVFRDLDGKKWDLLQRVDEASEEERAGTVKA